MVPEALATYHLFFVNSLIPMSCRANRPDADRLWRLKYGSRLPFTTTLEEVPRIFTGLGDAVRPLEVKSLGAEGEESADVLDRKGALVELEGDNARLAVLKRSYTVTHAAYPAVNMPPKVIETVTETLLVRKARDVNQRKRTPEGELEPIDEGQEGQQVVSDEELERWMFGRTKASCAEQAQRRTVEMEAARKRMAAAIMVTAQIECLKKFFFRRDVIKRLGESIHYLFKHGYVRQACCVCGVDLTNLVTYMGLMHENRVGQSVLHNSLEGEARRDYVRDTIYLLVIYTWQTAMGIWQQCLEDSNLKELTKILENKRRELWLSFDELQLAQELAHIVFPERLVDTLAQGLPDLMHQSLLHNFRSFILERSGLLPAMCCALPSDFVPTRFREAPPALWPHVFLLNYANYLMYHNDVAEDVSGEGPLLAHHCRCNLCSPHRSLALNPALLSETQCIGSFELQGPPQEDGTPGKSLKLTPSAWTNAYLRKFEDADYQHDRIQYFEETRPPCKPRAELTACVITSPAIVAQLNAISEARRQFLLKKGKGVYLDPQTGEELTLPGTDPVPGSGAASKRRTFAAALTEGYGFRHEQSETSEIGGGGGRERAFGSGGSEQQFRTLPRSRGGSRGGGRSGRRLTQRERRELFLRQSGFTLASDASPLPPASVAVAATEPLGPVGAHKEPANDAGNPAAPAAATPVSPPAPTSD